VSRNPEAAVAIWLFETGEHFVSKRGGHTLVGVYEQDPISSRQSQCSVALGSKVVEDTLLDACAQAGSNFARSIAGGGIDQGESFIGEFDRLQAVCDGALLVASDDGGGEARP
jgi:hypothetical protein